MSELDEIKNIQRNLEDALLSSLNQLDKLPVFFVDHDYDIKISFDTLKESILNVIGDFDTFAWESKNVANCAQCKSDLTLKDYHHERANLQ